VHREHRLYRADTVCPSCGIAMPRLPMCSLTHTCVECARRRLDRECENCPDRDICMREIQGIKVFRELENRLSMILPDLIDVLTEEVRNICRRCVENYNDENSVNMFVRAILSIINSLVVCNDPREWITTVFKPEMIRWIIRAPVSVITLSERCLSALRDYSRVLDISPEIVINMFKLLLLRFIEERCDCRTFIEHSFRRNLAKILLLSNDLRRSS